MLCALQRTFAVLISLLIVCPFVASAQRRGGAPVMRDNNRGAGRQNSGPVRAITIPITVRVRESGQSTVRDVQPADLTLLENGQEQQILSVRSTERAPLSLFVLIQDDVVPSIGNEIRSIATFIRGLPEGSRVGVGYARSGSLQLRQRFTVNLDRAASALRIPVGATSLAPFNPFSQIVEVLRRFESLPTGRRAIIVVSDGVDVSRGVDSSLPSLSIDLERAVREAQRRGVAVYSFYAPTVGLTASGNTFLVSNGQGSLARLSDETGGRAFFQGRGAPVSFDPFLRDVSAALMRQYALTYLSSDRGRGFRRIEVLSDIAELEIEHPTGYSR
jgi:VWFA-related protein